MAKSEQEIEVKFPVRDLAALARKLENQGAVLSAPRVREINLRFDTLDGALTAARRVLRLRQDAGAVMTYKGPAAPGEEVSSRQEIEFGVSDFGAARRLLEALGYVVSVMYEKFRTTYSLGELTVVLDEMPFGSFMEIEGPGAESIRGAAASLGLDWEARSTASYLGLFSILSANQGITAQNLSFAEFEGLQVHIEDMGLRYADGEA
jgi:adenylate cyclase class 2